MERICTDCFRKFYKGSRKGRNPLRCPTCRERRKEEWRKQQKEK